MAAENGDLTLLQWLRVNGCLWGPETCAKAASGGNLQVLQWLRANSCEWGEGTCDAAIEAGARPCFCDPAALTGRARWSGHVELLQWARLEGCPMHDDMACMRAAGRGQLVVLQWLLANGSVWDSYTSLTAAAGGHLEVLQWAREHGCPWSSETCTRAAQVPPPALCAHPPIPTP